jgi:hypothetical protein
MLKVFIGAVFQGPELEVNSNLIRVFEPKELKRRRLQVLDGRRNTSAFDTQKSKEKGFKFQSEICANGINRICELDKPEIGLSIK